MVSLLKSFPVRRLSFMSLFMSNNDDVQTPGYENLFPEKPSGMAGVRSLFVLDEYGELRPELTMATQMSMLSVFGGMMFGGFMQGREAWVSFMENNQATLFPNHLEAKKKLQDVVTFNMGKGAVKWGWKIGAFCTVCLFTNQIIAAYRGKPGLVEYIGAGAISGGLYKFNMGLRGLAAGSVVGAACGTVAGLVSVSLLKLSGFTMEDLQKTQYEIQGIRDEKLRESRKNMLKEEMTLLKTEASNIRDARQKDGSLDSVKS